MIRLAALAALLALGACGRVASGEEPDAGADQRAATAAKTLADLAAADRAARAPLPRAAPVHRAPPPDAAATLDPAEDDAIPANAD